MIIKILENYLIELVHNGIKKEIQFDDYKINTCRGDIGIKCLLSHINLF